MDLTLDSRWRPLRATFEVAGWTVDVWQEPRLPGEREMDPFLVRLHGDTLRLGVADPAGTCPTVGDAEVRWAAELAVGALGAHDDLQAAFAAAAARLCDPALRPRLANPTTALAAVDFDVLDGRVRAVRAGDCEVWVRDGAWRPLLAGPRLTSTAAAAFAAHPGADAAASDPQLHWQAHVDTLDGPQSWVTSPLGLVVPPQLEQAEAAGVTDVILADDGPRLTSRRCENLAGWLSGDLQRCGADYPHPSPHGAVTVLHARRAG